MISDKMQLVEVFWMNPQGHTAHAEVEDGDVREQHKHLLTMARVQRVVIHKITGAEQVAELTKPEVSP